MADPKPPDEPGESDELARFQKILRHMRFQLVLILVGITLFAFVLGVVLNWYINPQESGEKRDLVQAVGLTIAGVAGTIGIYFTWRGQRITQESLKDTRQTTEENLRFTKEGRLTERFTRAIDQLGAVDDKGKKKLEIRLGGIYALERIDKESTERAYHSTVMEVLTAFVRENSL